MDFTHEIVQSIKVKSIRDRETKINIRQFIYNDLIDLYILSWRSLEGYNHLV